eukprot:Skav223335  [mRNA]  locus=scaffold200:159910:163736:+ [translate_table: standard]
MDSHGRVSEMREKITSQKKLMTNLKDLALDHPGRPRGGEALVSHGQPSCHIPRPWEPMHLWPGIRAAGGEGAHGASKAAVETLKPPLDGRTPVMALSLRRVVALAIVALGLSPERVDGVSSLSAAISFVAMGGRSAARTDIVVAAMPLAQQEKDAYQFYRDGMQAQVAGDYSAALRAYAESLKLEEDPPPGDTLREQL